MLGFGKTKRIRELEGLVHQQAQVVQELLDTISVDPQWRHRHHGDHNEYTTKPLQVEAIMRRYEGVAEWGNDLVKRLVNLGAANTVARGLELVPEKNQTTESVKSEMEWLDKFVTANHLNDGGAIQLAREAGLQSQVLLQHNWSEGMDLLKYVPWLSTQ